MMMTMMIMVILMAMIMDLFIYLFMYMRNRWLKHTKSTMRRLINLGLLTQNTYNTYFRDTPYKSG